MNKELDISKIDPSKLGPGSIYLNEDTIEARTCNRCGKEGTSRNIQESGGIPDDDGIEPINFICLSCVERRLKKKGIETQDIFCRFCGKGNEFYDLVPIRFTCPGKKETTITFCHDCFAKRHHSLYYK